MAPVTQCPQLLRCRWLLPSSVIGFWDASASYHLASLVARMQAAPAIQSPWLLGWQWFLPPNSFGCQNAGGSFHPVSLVARIQAVPATQHPWLLGCRLLLPPTGLGCQDAGASNTVCLCFTNVNFRTNVYTYILKYALYTGPQMQILPFSVYTASFLQTNTEQCARTQRIQQSCIQILIHYASK